MLKDNKEIQNAKSVLEYLEHDEEAMRLYELREKAIHDFVSNINGAKAEGIQIVARNLSEQKVDIKIITAVTGLSEEEIRSLIINRD